MSRHRDKGYFRKYPQVWKMLFRETVRRTPEGEAIAKQNAAVILKKMALDHPRADYLILYVLPDRSKWLIAPVGMDEDILNISVAKSKEIDGKIPVAYCEIK